MIKDLRVVQKMVDMAVGVEKYTYQMNRNAPAPNQDFAAIKLAETITVGYPKKVCETTPLGIIYKSWQTVYLEFDVMFSRDDGEDYDKFNNCFSRPAIREMLHKEGYALMTQTPQYNADRKFETDWQARNRASFRLSTIRYHEDVLTEIDAVEINGEYNEGDYTAKIGTIKIGRQE